MVKFRSLVRGLVSAALLTGAACAPAFAAEAYPNRPVTVVAPFAAGGGVDVIARLFGQELAGSLGQPFVIENRPGASTLVGASVVAGAAPDGHTLMAATADTLTVASSLQKNPVTIPEETLLPVSQIVRTPLLLMVAPNSPYQTLGDLVSAAKDKPGSITYGSAGVGTLHHLSMEVLGTQAQIRLNHVPYRGSSLVLADLLGGHIDVAMLETPLALPQLASGKLRALAITTAERSDMASSVPTVAEQGYAGYSAFSWMGFAVPRQTPAPVVDKLYQSIAKAVAAPSVAKGLREMGLEPYASPSPAAFAQFAEEERARWTQVIKERGIVLD